jgi:hypothetical protein
MCLLEGDVMGESGARPRHGLKTIAKYHSRLDLSKGSETSESGGQEFQMPNWSICDRIMALDTAA